MHGRIPIPQRRPPHSMSPTRPVSMAFRRHTFSVNAFHIDAIDGVRPEIDAAISKVYTEGQCLTTTDLEIGERTQVNTSTTALFIKPCHTHMYCSFIKGLITAVTDFILSIRGVIISRRYLRAQSAMMNRMMQACRELAMQQHAWHHCFDFSLFFFIRFVHVFYLCV